jgi:hypothetical protein
MRIEAVHNINATKLYLILLFVIIVTVGYLVVKPSFVADRNQLRIFSVNIDLEIIGELVAKDIEGLELVSNGDYIVGVDLLKNIFKNVPKDPWGNYYYIRKKLNYMVIYSAGEDGKKGDLINDDDIFLEIKTKGEI